VEAKEHVPALEVPADLAGLEELRAAGLVDAGLEKGLRVTDANGLI